MKTSAFVYRQHLSITVTGFSIVCNGGCFFITYPWYFQQELAFTRELLAFLVVSAACSCVVFAASRFRTFLSAHALHLVSLIIIARILTPQHLDLQLVAMVPFLLETAIYFPVLRGSLINSGLLALVTWGNVVALVPHPLVDILTRLAPESVVVIVMVWLGGIVTFYRERVVKDEQLIASLDLTVANLSAANKEFQLYANAVGTTSAENERNRITRELHDIFGYALTNVVMAMNAAKVLARENPGGLPELFEMTRQQAETALSETRSTLYRLRSITDTPPKGVPAIRRLAKAFEEATGVEVELSYGNLPMTFGEAIDATMFRFIQEGLTNAFRHGRASMVHIGLWDRGSSVEVRVRDNGRGAVSVDAGIGLKGMGERFSSLGGAVWAGNVADGFELRASIPKARGSAP